MGVYPKTYDNHKETALTPFLKEYYMYKLNINFLTVLQICAQTEEGGISMELLTRTLLNESNSFQPSFH